MKTVIAITGSRRSDHWAIFTDALDPYCVEPVRIVSGDATGIDDLARRYCTEKGLQYKRYVADWGTYGRAGGPIRNRQMLQMEHPDFLLAFPGPASNGTWDCVNAARALGIPVVVTEVPS